MDTKICTKCKVEKSIDQFYKRTTARSGLTSACKLCDIKKVKNYSKNNIDTVLLKKKKYREDNREAINAKSKQIRQTNIAKTLLCKAKGRAKKNNLPFDLTLEDIEVPTHCPLLGILLAVGDGCHKPNSPTIDRLIPKLGYVRGNVWIISYKANTIKNNSTLEEFQAIANNWLNKVASHQQQE